MTFQHNSLKNKSRFNIGLIMTGSFDDYNLNIWKTIVKLSEINDVNLFCFPGGHLQSKETFSFNYQRGLVYDLINIKKIEGIIVLSASLSHFIKKKDFIEFLNEFSPLPIVSIGVDIKGIPSILVDNKIGMREMMIHLIKVHGYKRLAFIRGPKKNPEAEDRYQTYLDVLKEYNIPFNEKLVSLQNFSYDAGKIAITQFVEKNKVTFDAIVCCIDFFALSAINELKERGISVPEDVAVVGFDNIPQGYYMIPPLTTVNLPTSKLGEEAFNTLLTILNKQPVPEKKLILTQLVIRRSCNCLEYSGFSNQDYKKIIKKKFSNLSSKKAMNDFFLKTQKKFEIKYTWLKNIYKNPLWLKIMTNDLLDKIKKREKKRLLLMIEKIMIKGIENGVDLSDKNIITMILDILYKFLNDKDFIFFNNLSKEINFLIENMINRITMNETINKESQIYNLYEVSNVFVNCYDQEKLKEMIIGKFSEMGINCVYICLYEKGQRKYAKLFVGYNKIKKIIYKKESEKFKSNLLVPSYIDLSDRRYSLYILSLFFENLQIGYIIFEINQTARALYETIATQLSNALRGIKLIEKIKKYSIKLEEKVKERTLELENVNIKLQNLDSLKNDFIANITHDFRSPLTVILNIADLTLRFNKDIDSENKENYSIIYKASLRLKNSIDKLLELAKMDAKGIKLTIKKLDLVSFISRILDFYSSSVMSSGIKILKELPAYEIANFYTDVEKLEEIIDNVISNAIKFVKPKDGIIILSLEDKIDSVLIKISDNGLGISKDKLEVIFNRFEQIYKSRNSHYKGTGIGLAFAKQLVEYLKGNIWAESEGEGKGSKFFIELKKGKVHFDEKDFSNEPDEQKRKEEIKALIESEIEIKMQQENIQIIFNELNKENENDYKKGIILIIDDEKNIRQILMKYLMNYDYKNFILAADGKQGLEMIYEYSPDIIICDYNMPNMKGDQLHNEIINNPKLKEIPFLFLSAVADENLIIERRKKGASAYLKKPIDEKIFIITVEEQLKKYFEYLKIYQLATIDELTGLNNRRAIIASLKHELAIRKYRNLALIFLDIDFFKEINDEYGHQAGDRFLAIISKIIKTSIRSYDIAGRYGGDEFIIILLETNQIQATYVAEILRKTIMNTKIEHLGKQISTTSSFGVASLIDNALYIEKLLNINSLENIYNIKNPNGTDWNEIEKYKDQISEILLKIADTALYKAKQTICNNCLFTSEKISVFLNGRCPKCNSKDLIKGRNKVVKFK